MKTAIELIIDERKRQIEEEGWTLEHDDEHTNEELAAAASYYAMPESKRPYGNYHVDPTIWPWDPKDFKPTPDDRLRELVKSGGLILAAIERHQRLEEKQRLKEKKIRVIQVCEADCDKQPFEVEVGSYSYTFCCQKGFEKSLEDFAKTQGVEND